MFDILFLGTGASVPSRDKTLPALAVRQNKIITLFDCGEGTQRQLMVSQFSFMKIENIFITHFHGDHAFGLPGLLQTMGISGRKKPLSLYGPKGAKEAVDHLLSACEGEIEYQLNVVEVSPGDEIDIDYAKIKVFATEHGIPSVGYVYSEPDRPGIFNKDKAKELGLRPGPDYSRIQAGETVNGVSPEQVVGPSRKGCSFAYTGDTKVCDSVKEAVSGVDVLIHEATYTVNDSKLAEEYFHCTAKDAAQTAKDAGVRMLALVHISNRYGGNETSLFEAKKVFKETIAPNDLDIIGVMHSDIRLI